MAVVRKKKTPDSPKPGASFAFSLSSHKENSDGQKIAIIRASMVAVRLQQPCDLATSRSGWLRKRNTGCNRNRELNAVDGSRRWINVQPTNNSIYILTLSLNSAPRAELSERKSQESQPLVGWALRNHRLPSMASRYKQLSLLFIPPEF